MRVPEEGEQLLSAKGEVWIVLRCHRARDDPRYFAIDVIRELDEKNPQRSVNLTWDEFEEFCAREGISYT
jgi:hypothetical protein